LGQNTPWGDHYCAQVQADPDITEIADADIVNMERPRRTRNKSTLISFDFKSQDRYWTESMNQANQALMKAYTVELTDPTNPKRGQ
jgi:hypothetical protein